MFPAYQGKVSQWLHVSMVSIALLPDVADRQPRQTVSLWMCPQTAPYYVVRLIAILQLKMSILVIHVLVY